MTHQALLEVRGLRASAAGKEILKGLDLSVNAGEVHAIMGPNGSGKSTLSNVLMGHPKYEVTAGSVRFRGEDLLKLKPEERARKGLFLAFQYPVEVPGVKTNYFLKTAYNAIHANGSSTQVLEGSGKDQINVFKFQQLLGQKAKELQLSEELANRFLNHGFSGGEKKKSELLQMAVLEPKLAILDEIDSGLDIDAVKSVAETIQRLHSKENSLLLITHYQRLLDYITPDRVHILWDGRIVQSGGAGLAKTLESKGYDWVKEMVASEEASLT